MKSIIAHIAHEHNHGEENLATELLAYALRAAGDQVLRDVFAQFGLVLVPGLEYRVHVQRRGAESDCIPDIQLQDEDNKIRAIIESKFQAGFTPHQPNSYLKEIGQGDLLLFIVPEARRLAAFEKLSSLCRSSGSPKSPSSGSGGRTRIVVDQRILEVTSWENILEAVEQSVAKHSSERRRQWLFSDIEQLRRFCKVAEKQTFVPLTPEQIAGVGTPTLLRHLSWITQELITRSLEKGLVQPETAASSRKLRKNGLGAGFDSSPFFGQNLRLRGILVWIGFWPLVWEDHPESPLWIAVYPKSPQENRTLKKLLTVKGETFAFPSDEEGEWLIPIPIKPDLLQDDVVQDAVEFLANLDESFELAMRQ